jgi:hypothetical protein
MDCGWSDWKAMDSDEIELHNELASEGEQAARTTERWLGAH